jgi:hypothetical protein
MVDTFCLRCGKSLPRGSLKYIVDLQVYADFDGYLAEEGEDLELSLGKVLEEAEGRDEEELEEEVYLRQLYLVCKDCRDRFLSNPLNIPWSPASG